MGQAAPLRGVNLGGWLVLEQWMTPELFSGVNAYDEQELVNALSYEELKDLLTRHRKTFIHAADFARIAERGFNAVRIPVPWHILGHNDQAQRHVPSLEFLDSAFELAEKYGLKILIDLHTVPGSQNGRDHSGATGAIRFHRSEAYRQTAVDVIGRLAARYKESAALFGIEALNEPRLKGSVFDRSPDGVPAHFLRNYYRQAYDALRAHCDEQVAFVFHDAFEPWRWSYFMRSDQYANVWLDVHCYHCFRKRDTRLYESGELERAMKLDEWIVRLGRSKNKKVMIGEWSAGLSIPYGVMSPESHAAFSRRFVRTQLRVFNQADGWFFWNYKINADLPGWDARKALSFLEGCQLGKEGCA